MDLTDELLEKVVQYSSFDYMKGKYDDERHVTRAKAIEKIEDEVEAARLRETFGPTNFKIMRKGEMNDWKSYMTPEQNQRITDRFLEMCQQCDGLKEHWSKWNIF